MQEAYCPPCSKYSLCCPNWVPTPPGTPCQGIPPPGYPPHPGYPPGWTWQGTPPPGSPPLAGPGRVSPRQLPHGILGNVDKALWDMGTPLWTDRQTRVKTLPSRRTTYAGGNYTNVIHLIGGSANELARSLNLPRLYF